jgi:hypothetical protein
VVLFPLGGPDSTDVRSRRRCTAVRATSEAESARSAGNRISGIVGQGGSGLFLSDVLFKCALTMKVRHVAPINSRRRCTRPTLRSFGPSKRRYCTHQVRRSRRHARSRSQRYRGCHPSAHESDRGVWRLVVARHRAPDIRAPPARCRRASTTRGGERAATASLVRCLPSPVQRGTTTPGPRYENAERGVCAVAARLSRIECARLSVSRLGRDRDPLRLLRRRDLSA